MSTATYGLSPLLRAASSHHGGPVPGDLRLLFAGARDLDGLTHSDRELIAVVTGELIPVPVTGLMLRVSFFTLQLALDRLAGPLMDGADASIEYLEAVYTAYEETCPLDGNPVSGGLLDLALAFLVGRDLQRQERARLVA